ncbi:MAG: hypothetical protein LAQ69_22935 [Acidobacteriia bacterium]|nr:hypothetical protein [Terriglobia bacterium]
MASLILLVPCFWQSRLQAGDLSSHIYNAWLAQLIEAGRAPGLVIARQTTNVLFDLMLSGILRVAGAGAAQRIAVSLAVLVFIWGAFAFASVVSGRRAWRVLPIIAMLAYGWVFHVGFFNFYLSLGLCFAAMALCWEWRPRRSAAAVPVLLVAWLAHALPVAWTLSLLAYLWLARRRGHRPRLYLLAACLGGIVLLRVALGASMFTRWFSTQILTATGLDQVRVFDSKYDLILCGLVLIWGLPLLGVLRQPLAQLAAASIPFQFCVLTAFGILVLPTLVLLPGYKHALAFIAERMSLALGICICGSLAGVRSRPYQNYLLALVVLVFFGFLFRDEGVFNAFEDRMERLVAQLPPGQRVTGGITASNLHVDALNHMIDRVCLGRCYSYANYEPSTTQFRIRVVGQSPIVVSTYEDSWSLQAGVYTVKERDLPLYEINLDPNGRMVLLSLQPGGPSGMTSWNPL